MKAAKKRYYKKTPKAWKILRGDRTPRQITATWTIEMRDELMNLHGINIEKEITDALVKEIQNGNF